ncbi:ABC transporter ATP-binding protein [Clostridium isatidis]|uniref:Multidrug ABC transporter ATP-binding protein n=1 Tax=Clostridium isatidis TaxID=182773 RepID=A0A343JCH4_9CLOT|nr:ABC transporter ATP-binding protein [Clostridium isatidis]ASW43232.1 multidrug ABC transporter ATP-binding protein [Clostridium isatidis]
MKNLLKYFKGSAVIFAILAPLSMILEVSMDLLHPTLLSNIIDIGVAEANINYILKVGAYMIIVSILAVIGGVLCSFFASAASMRLAEDLREAIFKKVNSLSFMEIDKLKTASLITRLTNDVTQVQQMFNMALRAAVRSPLMAIGGIIMAVRLSLNLSTIFAVSIPIIIIGIIIILKKSMPLFIKVQNKLDDINLVMRENILGVRVIKSFNLEEKQKERFNKKNKELTVSSIASQNMNLVLSPFTQFIMNLSVVVVLWFGGRMVSYQTLELGKIMAFVNYMIQIMHSTVMVINLMMNFSRAKASADRINEILNMASSIKEKEDAKKLEGYDIEFRNVYFKFNEESENVLEDISFSIKEGERIGIIGPTGSGKSTIISLIPRLYDIYKGEILIGGINVKELKLKELRDNIGIVLQESLLLSGDIEGNIRFGNNFATFKEIEKSAKDAQAYEFINKKKNKYKEKVEQRAKNLSGGQKQRLSIARTLVRNPKILIMDDASSALDMKTQSKLHEAIKNRDDGATIITIAQRISAVMASDKIIVLDEGRISAIGSHDELIRNNEIYRTIAVSQLGEEVLSNV